MDNLENCGLVQRHLTSSARHSQASTSEGEMSGCQKCKISHRSIRVLRIPLWHL